MILAIDLGSTSFKAAVIDANLCVKGFSACEVQHRFASGGVVELDVAEADRAVQKAVRAALESAGLRPAKLHAVGVTSQAQTFTIVDERGRARMPFISWQDSRAGRTCEQLKRNRAVREFGRHCSFGSLVPALQICQLRHLRETRRGWPAADHSVTCLPTYFIGRWCEVRTIDENLAAMSGLYSLTMRKWWAAAVRLCGLRTGQLPKVIPIGAIAGHTGVGAAEFGLPKGIPAIHAGNDQTAGAYAARLDENRGLLVTLGTAQVAYTCADNMPRPNPDLVRGPFPGGRYYKMAADSYGGNVINWAKTILAGCKTDAQFFRLASQSPPGCRGLTYALDCSSGGTSWMNASFHHKPGDFARSVLESLARRMSELIRQLGVQTDQTAVLVAGGGSENPAWVRILSEMLGVKLEATEGRPCVGAARMALKTLQVNTH